MAETGLPARTLTDAFAAKYRDSGPSRRGKFGSPVVIGRFAPEGRVASRPMEELGARMEVFRNSHTGGNDRPGTTIRAGGGVAEFSSGAGDFSCPRVTRSARDRWHVAGSPLASLQRGASWQRAPLPAALHGGKPCASKADVPNLLWQPGR